MQVGLHVGDHAKGGQLGAAVCAVAAWAASLLLAASHVLLRLPVATRRHASVPVLRHEKAAEQYSTFLDIWAEADLDMDELEDARERLSRINSRS